MIRGKFDYLISLESHQWRKSYFKLWLKFWQGERLCNPLLIFLFCNILIVITCCDLKCKVIMIWFLPEASIGLRVLSLPVSVRPSVTKFVRVITHHPFKLGSPNLDHRCKRPWLRSLLFWGVIDLWPSRSNLTSKSKFTQFWACSRDNSSPIQARATKFGPEVLNTLVKIPVVLGVDWAWHVKFNLFSKSCLFASLLRLWNICETCKKRMKRSLFHILDGYAHICSPTETCHGPWNSRVVSLVWPLLASQSSTRRLAMDFCMLL